MCMLMCMGSCFHMCGGGQRTISGIGPWLPPSWRQDLLCASVYTRLPGFHRRSCLWLLDYRHVLPYQALCGFWRSKLSSSWLWSKCSSHWSRPSQGEETKTQSPVLFHMRWLNYSHNPPSPMGHHVKAPRKEEIAFLQQQGTRSPFVLFYLLVTPH